MTERGCVNKLCQALEFVETKKDVIPAWWSSHVCDDQ